MATPEIDAGHLKTFSCRLAKELDEGRGAAAFARLGGNTVQKLLEALIRVHGGSVLRRNDWTASRNAESRAETGTIGFAIHKCLNLLGKYLSSQFESREMARRCHGVKSRDQFEILSHSEKYDSVREE